MTAMEGNPMKVLLETGLLELEAILQHLHDVGRSGGEPAPALGPDLAGPDPQPDP